jgi:hypothetical protein
MAPYPQSNTLISTGRRDVLTYLAMAGNRHSDQNVNYTTLAIDEARVCVFGVTIQISSKKVLESLLSFFEHTIKVRDNYG